MPWITDDWIELRVEIDLDANLQTIYYDGEVLDQTVWQASGIPEVQAVDLFSNNGSFAYFDDLSLEPIEIGATRTVTLSGECPEPEGVDVSLARALDGADGAEMVTLREVIAGDIVTRDVTAGNGGVVEDSADPQGVRVTWEVSRQALADGLSYTVSIELGSLAFSGDIDGNARSVGDRVADVCLSTNPVTGQIREDQWAAIGPFVHEFGCNGPPEELLENHIANASIDCVYPSIGDVIDYDPVVASTTSYTGPLGDGDLPVWREIDDGAQDGFSQPQRRIGRRR